MAASDTLRSSREPQAAARPRVVIVGGGFGGLYAARGLARAPVDVTLVDRRNHHLFQPLLYQVATAGLSPGDIAQPIRAILRDQCNLTVLLADARAVDLARRRVVLVDGELRYDHLILATGATHAYFGHPEWAELAPGLKSLEDAIAIRSRFLSAFEEAERERDARRQQALLTFVIVGAGPTGVELAGTMAEMARVCLASDFRFIDPTLARVILFEGGPRVLPTYTEPLSASAKRQLERLGVDVRVGATVSDMGRGWVESGGERIETECVFWAAGVAASPLGASLGVPLDKAGRVIVESDLSVPGHPEVAVIGDLASVAKRDGSPVPGVAPAAIQMGRYAAARVRAAVAGRSVAPFRYRDKGSLATIGRAAAVGMAGPLRFTGFTAWLAWLLVHLYFLIGFRNRVIVLIQWAWAYLTAQRGARLITHYAPVALLLACVSAGCATYRVDRVSIGVDGTQGNGSSGFAALSADGGTVAFQSDADNLVPDDRNRVSDVFVHARASRRTERVSVDSKGREGDDESTHAAISADGRFVAFESAATNLVPRDSNGASDVFLRDRKTRTTERVSVAKGGAEANDASGSPALSADARYVAFQSVATNLAPGSPRLSRIYVRDRTKNETECVSVNDEGQLANNDCDSPAISSDGRWVAFVCNAWNMGVAMRGTAKQVYLRDRKARRTWLLSQSLDHHPGDWMSWQPRVAADGTTAFETYATNLVRDDANGTGDVVLAIPGVAPLELVSVGDDDRPANGASMAPSLSAHGRYVVFSSSATDLVSSDSNGKVDVFLRDRKSGEMERVSEAADGTAADGDSWFPAISSDGLIRAYESNATNLVPGDTNGYPDVFVQQVEPPF
ncbi:MAG: FAD-dependent oxidoreductase [bacterium]